MRTRVVSWNDAAEMKRVGRERRLGDAQQQRTTDSRTATLGDDALVFFAEAELVDLLLEQEVGVANFFDLHPAQHLANDGFDVLVARW